MIDESTGELGVFFFGRRSVEGVFVVSLRRALNVREREIGLLSLSLRGFREGEIWDVVGG